MRSFTKILICSMVLSGIVFASYADRGITRRAKKKTVILPMSVTSGNNKTSASGTFGGVYKGSLNNNCEDDCAPQPVNNQVMTYQRGNSIFIVPVRSKVVSSESDNFAGSHRVVVKPS